MGESLTSLFSNLPPLQRREIRPRIQVERPQLFVNQDGLIVQNPQNSPSQNGPSKGNSSTICKTTGSRTERKRSERKLRDLSDRIRRRQRSRAAQLRPYFSRKMYQKMAAAEKYLPSLYTTCSL